MYMYFALLRYFFNRISCHFILHFILHLLCTPVLYLDHLNISVGHCKRFQVIWNKLARLVRYCNIQSTLDVMKIDLTENDVYHPFINIQAFPSVYYFSKAAIDRPIKLNITGDTVSSSPDHTILKSPKAILDWVLSHGKIDRDELLQLLNV
jgi:hypothetical protein